MLTLYEYITRTLADIDVFIPQWKFDEQQADAFHKNWTSAEFKYAIKTLLNAVETQKRIIYGIRDGNVK
jgi:hypothetical protein